MVGRGLMARLVRGGLALLTLAALATAYQSFNFFFYFTVLSNLPAIVLFSGQAVRSDWIASNGRIRGAVTLYMVITGLVYAVLLRPIETDVGVTDPWINYVLHFLNPAEAGGLPGGSPVLCTDLGDIPWHSLVPSLVGERTGADATGRLRSAR